jgi:enterochelin esterase-like enzyme
MKFNKYKHLTFILFITILVLNNGTTSINSKNSSSQESNRVIAFENLLATLDNASLSSNDKMSLIDDFFLEQAPYGFPIMNETEFYIVFRSNESIVYLAQNFINVESEEMKYVPDTDLFYEKFTLESDALGNYFFYGPIWFGYTDPLNPLEYLSDRMGFQNVTANGIPLPAGSFYPMSILEMPDYEDDRSYDFNIDIGSEIEHFNFTSEIQSQYNRSIHVYLPPGYSTNTSQYYPTLYIVDGLLYLNLIYAKPSLDWLIYNDKIDPIIAVFIDTINVNKTDEGSDHWDWRYQDLGVYNCADPDFPKVCVNNYAEVIATELVPYIDSQYRTIDNASLRAHVGYSLGGHISLFMSNFYPDVFHLTGMQSGSIWPNPAAMHIKLNNDPKIDTRRYYVSTGSRMDVLEENKPLFNRLYEKNYTAKIRIFNKAHSFTNARTGFAEMIEFLFTDAPSDYSGSPVGYEFPTTPTTTPTTTTTTSSSPIPLFPVVLALLAQLLLKRKQKL